MAITKRNLSKHHAPERKIYGALSERSRATVWRHARGRPSKKDKSANRKYLNPCEEKALVGYVLQSDRNGYPIFVKSLRLLANAVRRQRSSHSQTLGADDDIKPPGKKWPQGFTDVTQDLEPKE